MSDYHTFSAIIDALGGSASFAKIIGKPIGTASAMKTRNSIPPAYWGQILNEARGRGISGITAETMAEITSQRRAEADASEAA